MDKENLFNHKITPSGELNFVFHYYPSILTEDNIEDYIKNISEKISNEFKRQLAEIPSI